MDETQKGNPRHAQESPSSRRRPASPPARIPFWARVAGVTGELLLTFGILVLAFVGWQLTLADQQTSSAQQATAQQASRNWARRHPSTTTPQPLRNPPVASPRPRVGELFGALHVPRLGANWARPLIGGTTLSVLNKLGAGWYPSTSMPGAVGNTAFASHRGGHGSNFQYLDTLRYGDKVVLETQEGWYVYDYRNTEYVLDTAVEVVNPVPQSTAAPQERLLTLTTCNPYPFTNGERMIVYSTFDEFYPRAGGLPSTLTRLLEHGQGN